MRIERGVCLVRQYLPIEALANVDPVLQQNPRHPLALHVKVKLVVITYHDITECQEENIER